VRPIAVLLLALPAAPALHGQAAVTTDLWRVAAGTLVAPPALMDDGTAPFWTPAASLADTSSGLRLGLEAVHTAAEIGISGALAAMMVRLRPGVTASATYTRAGFEEIGYTETSPETIGNVSVWAQTLSIGVAAAARSVVAGVAARALSGRLGDVSETRFALDLGVQARVSPYVRIGAATQFLDPSFGSGNQGAVLSLGAEARSSPRPAWGSTVTAGLRYGMTILHGEAPQHLVVLTGTAAGVVEADLGAARESTPSQTVWRSRLGVGVTAGRYRVRFGHDGGVNGFGGTWRFSLTVDLR
jgi:hypothetical protein